MARTPADARDVMVEGPGGILPNSPKDFRPEYQPTKRRLIWPNGAQATTYSAEAPSQLRGPEHDCGWADEIASWSDARKGDVLDTAWNNLMLGLRIGAHPQCVVTTTPKPNKLTRTIREGKQTMVSTWATYDNLSNLAPSFRDQVLATYEGTRIGRQELLGELLEDIEGALWTLSMIDDSRVEEAPEMRRLCVGVDPTGSDSSDADECGIVVVGKGADGHAYVLADNTLTAGPAVWARKAVAAYHDWKADKIVAEGNFGGQMVVETIHSVDKTVPVEIVNASRSKRQRAEPVAALYEQGRVHHVGAMPRLEDELTTWDTDSGWSPGRMDALVWGISWLKVVDGRQGEGYMEFLKAEVATFADTTCPKRLKGHLWRDSACVRSGAPQCDPDPCRSAG